MLAQGYRFGAPSWEAEEIDAQATQGMKCPKCDGPMHYEGYHNRTEYVALAVCNDGQHQRAF